MSNFRLNLPVDIPWKLIDVSADMMDTTFCNKTAPPPFRSSIALFGYEPTADELPEELCDERLTYLKVSCTITGFQPSAAERDQAIVDLNLADADEIALDRILEPYFACYGALINVAVFPFDHDEDRLSRFPHIIDFEPKTRDLYQIATEFGEILSGSVNHLAVGKSYMFADSTEDGWSMTDTNTDGGDTSSSTYNSKRTTSDQANFSVNSDFSREERETHSTATQLTQMYNLLQSYHVGTNRVSFLMLPRPNTKEPTNRRTFIDGLRMIEGMQDFFIVVARRKADSGLRVEVNLNTGHFPEGAPDVPVPTADPPAAVEKDVQLTLDIPAGGDIVKQRVSGVGEAEGLELDESAYPNGAHLVNEVRRDVSDSELKDKRIEGHKELLVGGVMKHNVVYAGYEVENSGHTGRIIATIRVRLRHPKPAPPATKADRDYMLITARRLCSRIESEGKCLKGQSLTPIWKPRPTYDPPPSVTIVDEPVIAPIPVPDSLSPIDGNGKTKGTGPFYRSVTNAIRNAMMRSYTSPQKYDAGEVGYLQTHYFHSRVTRLLPEAHLNRKLGSLESLPAEVRERLGPSTTFGEFLKMDLRKLSRKLQLSTSDTARLRATLLGISAPPSSKGPSQGPERPRPVNDEE